MSDLETGTDRLTGAPKVRLLAIRNIVSCYEKSIWRYLLFYDLDRQTPEQVNDIIETLDNFQCMSYILYSTKHGVHIVGLTPINSSVHGSIFERLQQLFPSYYSGQTLRLSRKEGEQQELLYSNLKYPIIENLFRIYQKRFSELRDVVVEVTTDKYRCVFEKYWSLKV